MKSLSKILWILLFSGISIGVSAQTEEELIQQVEQDLMQLGEAIEQFHADKGVLLIDFADDDTNAGQERLQNEFEGVGASDNGTRTMIDVFMPLVHFGYLDEIPIDPFAMDADSYPEYNTYIYYDEDGGIEEREEALNDLRLSASLKWADNWYLHSPGPNRQIDRRNQDDITLSRYQYYMKTQADQLVEQSYANMQKIGIAIEKLRQEHGVLLVDGWDDDTAAGIDRLLNVFDGVGARDDDFRSMTDILMPLVHFGYLDEIPNDPVANPFNAEYIDPFDRFYINGYIYGDFDPDIDGHNIGFSWHLDFLTGDVTDPLNAGDWVLYGQYPDLTQTEPHFIIPNSLTYQDFLYITNYDLHTDVKTWNLF